MLRFVCLSAILPFWYLANCQVDTLSKSRFVVGISAPELLHAGVNVDLGTRSQVGVSAGIGPSWGTVWPTISLEHKLYFGAIRESTQRRPLFFRQSGTYFLSGRSQAAIALTFGGDLKSKSRHKGWTIDLGLFLLIQNYQDKENRFYPAVRFQHYGYFRKKL